MVDVYNSMQEGTFGPDRAGGVPSIMLLDLCYPGEDELLSLAEGAHRCLTGEEKVLDYA